MHRWKHCLQIQHHRDYEELKPDLLLLILQQWHLFSSTLNIEPVEFYIDEQTILPATELEKKALFMARAAESARLDYIAEEIVEYGNQRIERKKKEQKKAGADKGRATRLKAD